MHRDDLPSYFRDDCLVAVLLSDEAPVFLSRCEVQIASGDRALLRRVIHLLRVACKAPLFDVVSGALPTELLVPVGPGWSPTLDLVEQHLLTDRPWTDDTEAQRDAVLALGFVEDWSRQLSVHMPPPQGADTAGRIVAALLPRFSDYGVQELRRRVLDMLLKIPRHVPNFLDLATRSRADDGDDPVARDLGELLVSTLGSAMVARDFPDVVIDQLRAQFMLRPADVASHHRHALDVDECFGIHDGGLSPFFPASALQGPFWALLRHHPRQAVTFIVELLNHAADWYGERRWPGNTLEPATRVTLEVPNAESVAQWANGRLYRLFRGQSVGPHLLQSALMALETWLLDIAEIPSADLELWLLHILRASNSVMATAVVTSVCAAHPTRSGRAALALLSCRELFAYDLQRVIADRQDSTGFLTGLNVRHAIYEDERKQANARAHRREGLEDLAVRLQLTDAREAVWALIDRHRAAVPAATKAEADLVWRLALHRMDVRGYRPVDPPPVQDGNDQSLGHVYFGPGTPEPALQQLVNDRQSEMAALSGHLRLLNKAHELWDRSGAPEVTDWRAVLDEARGTTDEDEDAAPEYARGGTLVVAAACLRDRRAVMTGEERAWCAERVARALLTGDDDLATADDITTDRFSPALATEPHLASVVPIIASGSDVPLSTDRMHLLATALTHGGDGVTDSVYAGAALYLHDGLALRCAAAAIRESEAREEERRAERPLGQLGTVRLPGGAGRVRAAVHGALVGGDEAASAVLGRLRFDSWAARMGTRRACEVLGQWPDWPEARIAFERVAAWLVETWTRDRRAYGQRERDHAGEQDLRRRLAQFALRCPPAVARALCAPIVAQVPNTPREVADFVQDLILGADDGQDTDCFWVLWQDFADATAAAPWATRLRRDDSYEQPLLDRLFLRTYWRKGVTHWRRLEGHAHRVNALAARLPAVTGCVEAYARFLYTVGRRSLPEAFLVLDEQFRRADATRVASHREVAYMLEVLLGRFVYAEPLRLKTQPQLRAAVLRLLDVLVDAGSSSAYRVRDDFVTPARAVAA